MRPIGWRPTPESLFFAQVAKTDGCWIWTGNINTISGYGRFCCREAADGSGYIAAHIYSYKLHHSPIAQGLQVRHSCHNRACVNPGHLSLGTHKDNAEDRVKAGRSGKTRKRLTVYDVEDVRRRLKGGETVVVIAEFYGVYHGTIRSIKAGRTWKKRLANARSGLTEKNVREIKLLLSTREHYHGPPYYKDIAADFGVSAGNIQSIASGKTWGWLEI